MIPLIFLSFLSRVIAVKCPAHTEFLSIDLGT